MAFSQDILTRIVNVHAPEAPSETLSLGFSARPTGFYKDTTPTVATLSVEGLPLLSPSTFKVNLPEGARPIPGFEPFYGGHTELTTGTMTASWRLEQFPLTGNTTGEVKYSSSGTSIGANKMQIKVVLQLRPLDFLAILSGDNHYDWQAFAVAPVTPTGSMSKSGRAETGQTLIFILDVTMEPPSAKLTAG